MGENVDEMRQRVEQAPYASVEHGLCNCLMDKSLVIAPGINLPPILFKDKIVIINYSKSDGTLQLGGDAPMVVRKQFPLVFTAAGLDSYAFPIDPFISVSFKNIITRRSVAKGDKRGTVKERWTEDDAEINISGGADQ